MAREEREERERERERPCTTRAGPSLEGLEDLSVSVLRYGHRLG